MDKLTTARQPATGESPRPTEVDTVPATMGELAKQGIFPTESLHESLTPRSLKKEFDAALMDPEGITEQIVMVEDDPYLDTPVPLEKEVPDVTPDPVHKPCPPQDVRLHWRFQT